ncbi:armadillo repeat-containing protein 5 [Synchiropus splendidus]|uniref:armadillo repeat-containing protein 5 n=1 Tax=Synchiropus splendidus TaxID=270530 RepID=UPI00237DCE9E|nr:armadillo repeat-containing protein 5 [Synchiropus splendidus]
MAASPEQGDHRQSPQPSLPESSLTWCLAHVCKPRSGSEHQEPGKDKRSRVSQWRALVAIRTQHIKGDKAGISRFRARGGLRLLLDLLRDPECSRKTLDLALSILANCCTEPETRVEVRKLDGINVVVDILKRNVALETVQNRAARALGNLAMDSENSALIHSAGGVPLLLLCVSLSSAPSSPTTASPKEPCPKMECAQSAARTLLYLSDTPAHRLSLLTQGTLSAVAPLIAPEYPQALRRAALRALHELTRGCGPECAREVSRSGVLAQLTVMAQGESGKPFEELALKTLANMCAQAGLRPLVGSLGVIQKFVEEVKRDLLKSGVFLKALCLCCKEAVNRAKVKESGGLEVLIRLLSEHQSHPLTRLAVLAFVDFVFDETAMEQLLDLGLVPLLVARLVDLTRDEDDAAQKMDVSVASVSSSELSSPFYESYDFPPPEGSKKEDVGREPGLCSSSFSSLRSWLVSEGLIPSEDDLLDADWPSLHIPSTSSSPNPDSNLSPMYLSPSVIVTSPSSSEGPLSPSLKALDPSLTLGCQSATTPCTAAPSPVSPSKFSSPLRRRQRQPSSALPLKTLETPPPVPRSVAYQHPYHPEPWTPESPILLLLSRFSHATDPSAALVTSSVMSSLICYLTQHPDPSSRCVRMLCRLSVNPNCLQAMVRSGAVALIHRHLCLGQGETRQPERVRTKVQQLGLTLLNNLHVQCESGFGAGVLAHVMLSGSESDKLNCALALPLISSNKSLLKKLLLDSGGLNSALLPLGCRDDNSDDSARFFSNWTDSPLVTSDLQSLYYSHLAASLWALVGGAKLDKKPAVGGVQSSDSTVAPPPPKRKRLGDDCPYHSTVSDLLLQLDDDTRFPANREAVAGADASHPVGSEYFRALLRGGFGEALDNADQPIRIQDVSTGMLEPVLHFLHGCRLQSCDSDTGRRCRVLDSLRLEGLGPADSVEGFWKSPIGEAMAGACRFLVSELQVALEELCVSLLLNSQLEKESPEENLASQTSELALETEDPAELTQTSRSDPVGTEPAGSQLYWDQTEKPKKSPGAERSGPSRALVAALPQVYQFCQRYSYPELGRACLLLLLGHQNCPQAPLSSALAATGLRQVVRECDSMDGLKRDLLALVSAALS